MKKITKRLLFGVILSLCLITKVDAAKVELGSLNNENNLLKANIFINIDEGENFDQVSFKCDSGNSDVTCEIKAANGISILESGGGYTLSNAMQSFDELNPIGILILTNKGSLQTNGTVALTNVSINGQSVNDNSKSYKISPEKVVSTDATLKGLTVSKGTITPNFEAGINDYIVYDIADTINSIRFTPTCNAGKCTVEYSGGKEVAGNQVTLNQGENKITLVVTAEDGSTKNTYNFTVYRGESAFNSTKLTSLSIGTNKLDPSFDSNVTEYKVTVPNTVADLNDILQYELQDPNAKAEVTGLDNLVVGENTVIIKVTNSLETGTKEYKIIVTRMDDDQIEILSYKDGIVTFRNSKGEEESMTLNELKNKYPQEHSKIVNKTYKFDEDGNLIKDTEVKEKKGLGSTPLLILLIVGGLAIIGVSGYFIFRKPSDKKKKKDDKDKKSVKKDKDKDKVEEKEEVVEEKEIGEEFSQDEDTTVSIDVALNDLMNTKQYDLSEEPEKKKKEEKKEEE